ncbi:MAG: D-sedoheptulose 7-phosphate isomerase [Chloroflexota bacterium]
MIEYSDLELQYAAVVRQHFLESADVKRMVADELSGPAARAAELISTALMNGHKMLVFGNGGSAADAQHFAGEMIGRFKIPVRAPLPVIALTTDSTVLTCIANDFAYEDVFSRQVEALAQPGDIVLGISTSGNSPNVLRALQAARLRGAYTLALLGGDGGAVAAEVNLALVVPVRDTTRIQECHITLIHALSELIENRLNAL